jgi:hypothetical protein
MRLPDADKMITEMNSGAASGVINIQVRNNWFAYEPHEKSQLTPTMCERVAGIRRN